MDTESAETEFLMAFRRTEEVLVDREERLTGEDLGDLTCCDQTWECDTFLNQLHYDINYR